MSKRRAERLDLLLDPGHGGDEPGAVSREGLQEKELNLSVARALVRSLSSEGLSVELTRAGDETVTLDERCALRERLAPRVFLSLHHNDAPEPVSDRVETYCPFVRVGPSFDLAWAIMRRLAAALKLPHRRPLPSKYRVLTGGGTAVLVEAFYVRDVKREELDERLAAEASAVARGVVEFLSESAPVIRDIALEGGRVRVSVEGRFEPTGAQVSLDGRPLETEVSVRGFSAVAPDLPPGKHTLDAYVSSERGRNAEPRALDLTVPFEPVGASCEIFPSVVPPKTPALVTVHPFDAAGNPPPDGETVDVTVSGRLHAVECSGGAASLVLTGDERFTVVVAGTSHELRRSVRPDRACVHGEVRPPARLRTTFSGRTRLSKHAAHYWLVARGSLHGTATFVARGFLPEVLEVSAAEGTSVRRDVALRPVNGGLMHATRIVLDPASSEVLPLAVAAHNHLAFCGAEPSLTTRDVPRSLEERVFASHETGASVVVVLERGEPRVAHYYRDKAGHALAESVLYALSLAGTGEEFSLSTTSDYAVIQPDGARVKLVVPEGLSVSAVAEALVQGILSFLLLTTP